MSIRVPCNSIGEPADERDVCVAIAAGGITWEQLKRKINRGGSIDDYWLDEHTDLYIPNGVLLFRPWRRHQPKKVQRDEMQLEG